MSSNVYTLPELVDLALKTPEIGAVNFNILRVILHKILTECKLQNVTGEWKPTVPPYPLMRVLSEELPDHPILKRIDEERKQSTNEITQDDVIEKERIDEIFEASEDNKNQVSEDLVETDIVTVKDIIEQPAKIEKSDKEKFSKKVEKKVVEEIPKEKSEKKRDTRKEISSSPKPAGLTGGSHMQQLWELNKLIKRIEAVEEELNSIVKTVDEISEWKDSKTKRFQLLEGDLESGYSGPTISREEFEDTIEELGEALTLLRTKQKEQIENSDVVNQDIIKKLHLMASVEDMNEGREELKKKLNTLSKAIRSLQELMKDVIYPETCGITKCICCKRKAHLPLSSIVIDQKKKIAHDSTKSKIRNVSLKKDHRSAHELSFTTACLKRLVGEDDVPEIFDDRSEESLTKDDKHEHPEEPVITQHLVNLEAFEVSKLTRDFAPLRRDYIQVPRNRPRKAPVTIFVGSKEANSLIKKYPDK